MTEIDKVVEAMQAMIKQQGDQVKVLTDALRTATASGNAVDTIVSCPAYVAFDSTQELWCDYEERFQTFIDAHSVPQAKQARVFLTNQSAAIYKMLSNLACQQTPPKTVHQLNLTEIKACMKEQFDSNKFVVRERFRFWSDLNRKPGETVQELASRIRQGAATCDFKSIKDPLDDAMTTRFMCSVSNEAVLKSPWSVH